MTPFRIAPALASRPLRHLIDLWLLVALYVALKGAPGGADKGTNWGFGVLAIFLALVWLAGRLPKIRNLCAGVLDDAPSVPPQPFESQEEFAATCRLPTVEPTFSRRRTWLWFFTGLSLVATGLAYLEWRQPFYFAQDDNLSQFLPVMLQGSRSLVNDGVFPTWNPHQFLGSPTTSLGTYALTYPVTYASYAVAKWIVGNEFATLDVFCIAHLLAGYAAMFWACRVVGLRLSLASIGSVCFVLSGFFLIAGRSWYYMTPTAVWMPVLVGLLELFRRREVGWKWVLATGFTFGALFHAGNAQMWAYAALLFSIGVIILLVCRAVPWSRVVQAVCGVTLGVAIALPLLLPQYLETAKVERHADDGALLRFLHTMFLPYPLAQAAYPGVTETPHIEHMGHIYYSGTVFSVVAFLGMLSLVAHRWSRRLVAANLWLPLGLIALVMALGRIGGLWYLQSKVPPFNAFMHPFKYIPFATLFMVLGGALLVERALRRWNLPRRWELTCCTAAVVFMAYHMTMVTPSFCDYGFRPFPELPQELLSLRRPQSPQRIYAVAPRRSLAPEYACSLMHQLPSVWGLHAFEGYDPLVRRGPRFGAVMDKFFTPSAVIGLQLELGLEELGLGELKDTVKATDALKRTGMEESGFWGRSFRIDLPQALAALRAYGVRWVVLYTGPENPQIVAGNPNEMFWKTDPIAEQVGEEVKEQGRLLVHRPEFCVYELKGAAPLAFTVSKPRKTLPIVFNAAGLSVDTTALVDGGEIIVNVVEAPYLRADIDGKAVAPDSDKWGRLTFTVPPGAHRLSVRYQPPWIAGAMLGLMLAAAMVATLRWHNRRMTQLAADDNPPELFPLPQRRAA